MKEDGGWSQGGACCVDAGGGGEERREMGGRMGPMLQLDPCSIVHQIPAQELR